MLSCEWNLLGLSMAVFLIFAAAGPAQAQAPNQDFSKLDPAWMAAEYDKAFTSGADGEVWRAIKAGFPVEYGRFLRDMAMAAKQNRDFRPISSEFLQAHTAGQSPFAAKAPAPMIVAFQKRKAEVLEHLSRTDVASCAAIAMGQQVEMNVALQLQLNRVTAALVNAAAAGHKTPQLRAPATAEDYRRLYDALVAQGIAPDEARTAIAGPIPESNAARCKYGLMMHRGLAAAPPELVAKLAISAPATTH